jgi:hypothetical protein
MNQIPQGGIKVGTTLQAVSDRFWSLNADLLDRFQEVASGFDHGLSSGQGKAFLAAPGQLRSTAFGFSQDMTPCPVDVSIVKALDASPRGDGQRSSGQQGKKPGEKQPGQESFKSSPVHAEPNSSGHDSSH